MQEQVKITVIDDKMREEEAASLCKWATARAGVIVVAPLLGTMALMLTSAVVFIGITLIGGLWSSGLSNIVSVLLIYLGVLYSAYTSVSSVGGLDALQAALPQAQNMLSPVAGMRWFESSRPSQ